MGPKAAGTRAAILDRAVDIASIDGLEGLTIGRLAGELQMSKSGLFAHFGSKEELQLATLGAAAERFFAAVIAPAQSAPEGAERLAAYCDGYIAYLQGGVFAGGCFFAAVASEFDDRPGAVRDAIGAGIDAWLAELERQAALAGAPHPAELAFEVYALALGANVCSRLLEDGRAFAHARATLARRLAEVGQPAEESAATAKTM